MKIQLRHVTKSDITFFFRHQLDPEANAMVGIPAGDPTDRAKFDEKWSRILSDKSVVKRTIVVSKKVAGYVTCFLAPWSKRREIGYWIGKEFWGQGIASDALSQFLRIESTRPLYATVAKHNLASIRVLEKSGFVFTGPETIRANGQIEIEELTLVLE